MGRPRLSRFRIRVRARSSAYIVVPAEVAEVLVPLGLEFECVLTEERRGFVYRAVEPVAVPEWAR